MTTARWNVSSLDELGLLKRGRSRHRPRNAPFLYGGPYPFIQTADITNSQLHVVEHKQTYSEAGLAQSEMWDKGTLCIVNAGVNTGDSAILNFRACFPDSVIGFVANNEKCDVCFIKYFLDSIKPQIRQITMGATQDNLSVSKLLSFRIPTPPVRIQRKIASILSAYDRLIENNVRRIKILEEMAQGLYREWFEEFRFPAHEKVDHIDSSLGRIPEGWEIARLSKVAKFVKGVEPGSKNYQTERYDGLVPFLRVGDLGKRESAIFVSQALTRDRVLRPEDIAVTMDGTVGLVRMGLEGAYSSGIRRVVVRAPNRIGWVFVYMLLRSNRIQAIIHAHAKGTTIKHASSSIDQIVFALPPPALMEHFENRAAPLLKQRLSLEQRNAVLRRTRDLLLPKLVSGDLAVAELDGAVASGAP